MGRFRIIEERKGVYAIQKKGFLMGWYDWGPCYYLSIDEAERYLRHYQQAREFKKRVIGYY